MGIIPKPPEYGDDCMACFDPGKTPLYLKCFFSGIKTGELWLPVLPPPPNGYWDLEQHIDHPCIWIQSGPPPPTIGYRVGGPTNHISFVFQPGVTAFRSILAPGCQKHFTNDFAIWGGAVYYGGYCYIETSNAIQKQIEAVTPMIDPDPRMECFPMADEHIVIRYAGKRDATNISIKIDTNP